MLAVPLLALMQPLVFLGPSLPLDEARALVDAEFRPPVRRGDLDAVPGGTSVALIDGVFEQSLAVSPREVHDAVRRGVDVVGGGSMGALRAAEVPGVRGVGRIYDWYRDGVIVRDDEVALLFDEDGRVPLTVPMVNVRFAVERLTRPGTIERSVGDRIVAAALEIPYERRRYRTILRVAGLHERPDAEDLIGLLETHDLKREDAQAVLEAFDRHLRAPRPSVTVASSSEETHRARVEPVDPAEDSVLIWESGDEVAFDELLLFLACTGKLERYVRRAAARFALEGNLVEVDEEPGDDERDGSAAREIFKTAAVRWGWISGEELTVTLRDLGLEVGDLAERCREEAATRRVIRSLVTEDSPEFRRALRAELFLDDLALKRETMRCAALRWLASRDDGADDRTEPGLAERSDAMAVLCRLNRVFVRGDLRDSWKHLGLDEARTSDFVEQLARARVVARRLITRSMPVSKPRGEPTTPLRPCPKVPGDRRFSVPLAEAVKMAEGVGATIGVTRVGMIGELGGVGGVQIAQAARPQGRWSSTYGSGKSRSPQGAVVGALMEETEKWAQESYAPPLEDLLHGSFAELCSHQDVVDPATLDLPYDTSYGPEVALDWVACDDLLSGHRAYIPLDVLRVARGKHDIAYTLRGARKAMATNGLGSGFSREEAIVHATCEFIERHAERIAELRTTNPGQLVPHVEYPFVDLDSCSPEIRSLVEQLRTGDATVRVRDITSEIGVPTVMACVVRDLRRAEGQASHPDPEVAIEMALLEAAQTIATNAAGGREDLSVKARSLGRHERPRPVDREDVWSWIAPDPRTIPVSAMSGAVLGDVRDELEWILDRLRDGGVERALVADLGTTRIAPAHVVRVLLPGLETNNPFYTGPRARACLLGDMVVSHAPNRTTQ